jgi:hypothetical protein
MRRIEYIANAVIHAGQSKNHVLTSNPLDTIHIERLIVLFTVALVVLIVAIGTFVGLRSRHAARRLNSVIRFSPLAFTSEAPPAGDLLEAVRLINNENLAGVSGSGMSPERLTEMVNAIAAPRSREARTHDG